MAGPVDDLRELDRRDAELGARAEQLREADAEVAAIRQSAEEIASFFATYPDEDARLRAAVTAARTDLATREDECREAQAELDGAHDDEERTRARHALHRAGDHLVVAGAAVERALAEHEALDRKASELPGELDRLEEQSRQIAESIPDVPPPGEGPAALVEWASRAHAALFVANGSVDTQRERVIREANELATAILGEPTYGSTVAQARARVERARGER
jgi:seryl-tRNA synthetase